MAKRPTYAQQKAKKNWLLHTTSNRKRFKRKSRISSCKARVRSISVTPHKSSQQLSFFARLSDIKEIFCPVSEVLGTQESNASGRNERWRFFGFEYLNLLGISGVNIAFGALMNGAHCVQETCVQNVVLLCETFKKGLRCSFKGIELCREKFKQTSSVIFPSSSYKRKLDALNGRIDDLEMEIKKLKTSHINMSYDHCHGNGTTAVMPTAIKLPIPAPPPPPPPPPPLVPPPDFTFLKSKKTTKTKAVAAKENTTKRTISLDDIKSIKLRKVRQSPRNPLQDVSRNCSNLRKSQFESKKGFPVVTLKDLMGVKLKNKTDENRQIKSTIKTPEIDITAFRSNLRRVHHKRSPGGTPMDKIIQDTGVGLTPLMTRALKKKFEFANPLSVSPEELSPSPRRNKRHCILSPVEQTPSPFSFSPVSIR